MILHLASAYRRATLSVRLNAGSLLCPSRFLSSSSPSNCSPSNFFDQDRESSASYSFMGKIRAMMTYFELGTALSSEFDGAYSKKEFLDGAKVAMKQVVKLLDEGDFDALEGMLIAPLHHSLRRAILDKRSQNLRCCWAVARIKDLQIVDGSSYALHPDDKAKFDDGDLTFFSFPVMSNVKISTNLMSFEGGFSRMSEMMTKYAEKVRLVVQCTMKERRAIVRDSDELDNKEWVERVHHWVMQADTSHLKEESEEEKDFISWEIADIDSYLEDERDAKEDEDEDEDD